MTKSCSWAFLAASMTFSVVVSLVLLPYLMLSAMLQSNSTGSWDTTPIFDLRNCTFTFLVSCPSINYQEIGENIDINTSFQNDLQSQLVYSISKWFVNKLQARLTWGNLKYLLHLTSLYMTNIFHLCLWFSQTLYHLLTLNSNWTLPQVRHMFCCLARLNDHHPYFCHRMRYWTGWLSFYKEEF